MSKAGNRCRVRVGLRRPSGRASAAPVVASFRARGRPRFDRAEIPACQPGRESQAGPTIVFVARIPGLEESRSAGKVFPEARGPTFLALRELCEFSVRVR